MSDRTARDVVSRRARPAKAPLSRDVIVATALEILEKDGLAGLSLRRVATALDTGAASLYVYLANLDELYALMLDRALGTVEIPEHESVGWRGQIKNYLLSYLRVLHERRGLANLALSTVATGPNSLQMWEVLLGLLKQGGVADDRLVWSVDMLVLHVTTVAAERSNQQAVGLDVGRVERALTGLSPEHYPLLSSLFKDARFSDDGDDGDAPIAWSIDVIIDGIVANQAARSSSATRFSPK